MKKWLMIGTAALLVAVIASTAVVAAAQGGNGAPGGDFGRGGPGIGGGRGGFGFGGDLLTIVAEQLSIEQTELRTELQSGKTIAELAAEKSVSTDAIIEAVVAAQQESLASAVEDGRLTQAQADARLELARVNAGSLLDQSFTPSADELRGGFAGGLLTILAEQLGIEQSELATEIQAGKTIAQLAEENNVDTAAIVDAIVAAQQEAVTNAVADSRLTEAQADARLELARANAEALLDQPLNGGGFGLHDNGFGGHGGFDDHRRGFLGGHGGWGDMPVPPAAEPEATATPNV